MNTPKRKLPGYRVDVASSAGCWRYSVTLLGELAAFGDGYRTWLAAHRAGIRARDEHAKKV
jgi:hypothetical protein